MAAFAPGSPKGTDRLLFVAHPLLTNIEAPFSLSSLLSSVGEPAPHGPLGLTLRIFGSVRKPKVKVSLPCRSTLASVL